MHIISVVASTIFNREYINFVSAVSDLKVIYDQSFFNLKSYLFPICEVYNRVHVSGDAVRNS